MNRAKYCIYLKERADKGNDTSALWAVLALGFD